MRTNVNARYRDGFQRVGDTGVNTTINSVSYDVYDKIDVSESVDVNLSVQAEIARGTWGAVSLDVRVNNLFNSVLDYDYVSTSEPYELGRNAWVGIKYRY